MSIITKHRRLLFAALSVCMFVLTASAQPPTLDKLRLNPLGTTAYEAQALDKNISGTAVIPGVYNNKPVTRVNGFSSCPGLTGVIIPENVTLISGSAFYNCSGLTSVAIPSTVTKIENYGFGNCNNLNSVTLMGSVIDMNASNNNVFPGDLVLAYQAGGAGVYTRPARGANWTKQGGASAGYGPPPRQQPVGNIAGGGGGGYAQEPEQRPRHNRPDRSGNSFTDRRDGRTYRTVNIGGQIWMAENLNYQPRSGASWCYNNDNSYCGQYGRLYDWNTAMSACPDGWHLPSRQEWNELAAAAGGDNSAGKALKSTSGWNNGNGTDNFGFSALPGGQYRGDNNKFYDGGVFGSWWSSEADGGNIAHRRYMPTTGGGSFIKDSWYKNWGFSVRCVIGD